MTEKAAVRLGQRLDEAEALFHPAPKAHFLPGAEGAFPPPALKARFLPAPKAHFLGLEPFADARPEPPWSRPMPAEGTGSGPGKRRYTAGPTICKRRRRVPVELFDRCRRPAL